MIKNRTAILALLTGLNLLNYIDRYVVAAVLKKIQEPVEIGGLDLSNLQAGLLATAFLAGYFVTSPIFGARADKGKRTGLIAFGVIVWTLSTFATGLTHSFATMMVARDLRRRRRGELRDARADDHRRPHAAGSEVTHARDLLPRHPGRLRARLHPRRRRSSRCGVGALRSSSQAGRGSCSRLAAC